MNVFIIQRNLIYLIHLLNKNFFCKITFYYIFNYKNIYSLYIILDNIFLIIYPFIMNNLKKDNEIKLENLDVQKEFNDSSEETEVGIC